MGRRTSPRRARDKLKKKLEGALNTVAAQRVLIDAGLAVIQRQRDVENQLRASIAMDRGLLQSMRASNEELRQTVDTVATVLGPYFIGLPPKVVDIGDHPLPELWRLQPYQPMLAPVSLHVDPAELTFVVRELPTYRGGAYYDLLRNQLHITLKNWAGDQAYVVDHKALASMPHPVLVEHVANQFANVLAEAVSKEMRHAMKPVVKRPPVINNRGGLT